MSRTFDGGDYTRLTKNPEFHVTEVMQQASSTVGEKGTEAAAATAAAPSPRVLVSSQLTPQ